MGSTIVTEEVREYANALPTRAERVFARNYAIWIAHGRQGKRPAADGVRETRQPAISCLLDEMHRARLAAA